MTNVWDLKEILGAEVSHHSPLYENDACVVLEWIRVEKLDSLLSALNGARSHCGLNIFFNAHNTVVFRDVLVLHKLNQLCFQMVNLQMKWDMESLLHVQVRFQRKISES